MTTLTAEQEETRDATRIVLRPVATPLSLGFLALAVASFVLSGLELRWVSATVDWNMIGLVVLVFAVPLQSTSAILGFLARDAVAATGMGILAGSWLAIGAATFVGTPDVPSSAVGLLLLGTATALAVPALAGVFSKVTASLVLGMVALRFYFTGAYEMTASTDWRLAAGVCGLVVSALALYAALAFELESVLQRTVLPTGRRNRGQRAFHGSLADEIAPLLHEPGVRQQL